MHKERVVELYHEFQGKYAPQSDTSKPTIPLAIAVWLAAHGYYGLEFHRPLTEDALNLYTKAMSLYRNTNLDRYSTAYDALVDELFDAARNLKPKEKVEDIF